MVLLKGEDVCDVFDVVRLDYSLIDSVDDKLIYADLERKNQLRAEKKIIVFDGPSISGIGRTSFLRKSETGMFDVDVESALIKLRPIVGTGG